MQTHVLCNPKEPKGHKRKGYTRDELRLLFMESGFSKVTFHDTFNWAETIGWEIVYATNHNLSLDVNRLINFDISKFTQLGILAEVKK